MNVKRLQKIALLIVLFVMVGIVSVNASVQTVSNITFDSNYYSNYYGDLSAAFGTNASKLRAHFANDGIKEGRVASPVFDVKYYLANNGDVRAAFGLDYEAAYNHFIHDGIKEGRVSSPVFDVKYYLEHNGDVRAAFGMNYEAAYNHFLNDGIKEGRVTSPNFEVRHYLANNGDVSAAYGENYALAYSHYIFYGMAENRNASAESHVYGDAVVTKEATCNEVGERVATCSVCGTTVVATIPTVAHTEVVDEAVEATCTTTGKTEGKHCSVCNAILVAQEEIKVSGHKFELLNEESAKTCGASATIACKNEGCEYNTTEGIVADEVADQLSEEEKAEFITNGHEDELVIIDEPTCTTKGWGYHHCKNCEEVEKEYTNVDEIPHDYTIEIDRVDATCGKDGSITYLCSICKEAKMVDTESLKATGEHGETISVPVMDEEDPTIIKEIQVKCTVCGNVLETLAPTECPHQKDETKPVTQITAPTCHTTGTETATCSICGEEFTNTIETLPHNYKTISEVSPATCTAARKLNVICQNEGCNHEDIIDDETEAGKALGHKFAYLEKDGKYDVEPSCGVNATSHCLREGCEFAEEGSYEVENSAVSHNFIAVQSASCEEAALIRCKVIGCEFNKADGISATDNAVKALLTDAQKTEFKAKGHNFAVLAGNAKTCDQSATIVCENLDCEYNENNKPEGILADEMEDKLSDEEKEAFLATGHKFELLDENSGATCSSVAKIVCANTGCEFDKTNYMAGIAADDASISELLSEEETQKFATKTAHKLASETTKKYDSEASCTAAATTHCEVENCDKHADGSIEVGTALGHSYYAPYDTAATCEENAKTHCTRVGCALTAANSVTVEDEEGAKLGHAWTVVTPATCDAAAKIVCTHEGCAYAATDAVASFDATTVMNAVAAEYFTDAQKIEFSAKSETGAHTFGKWVVVTEPTETVKGKAVRNCRVCNHVETRDNLTAEDVEALLAENAALEEAE